MTERAVHRTRLRVTGRPDDALVRVLIRHPMETGRRRDAAGAVVPAHYIEWLELSVNGEPALHADWGSGVSRNPYLAVRLAGLSPGDVVAVRWRDNLGHTGEAHAEVG